MRKLAAMVLAGVSVTAMAQAGHAQMAPSSAPSTAATTTAATPPAAASANDGVGDILVTARRTSERLQTVPVAVTALTGKFLDRQNIMDATALPNFAPSVTFAMQPSSLSAASVFIRGIGNDLPNATAEPGVGIYLDGVYVARTAGAVFDLVDLERIEVLRGPQGTTFGRNTIGGAIQLISKKPTDDFHLTVKAGDGRYNDWYVRSRIDTGYLFGTKIKASVAYEHHQADGYITNTLATPSTDPGAINSNSVTVALQGDFDKVTVNYNFDFDHRSGVPGYFQLLYGTADFDNYFSKSASLGGAPFVITPVRQQVVQQIPTVQANGVTNFDSTATTQGHALTIAYDPIPELTIKSITGYRKFDQNSNVVLGGEGYLLGNVLNPVTFQSSVQPVYPFQGPNNPNPEHQFSQELQALGKSGDFSYLAGLYYFDEHAAQTNDIQNITFVLPGGAEAINLVSFQDVYATSESEAAFGQLTWKPAFLDEKFEITGGGRYTHDKKTAFVPASTGIPAVSGEVAYNNFSFLVSADYHFTTELMLYGRISTGYHAGGINAVPGDASTFAPEKATAYEVGVKSEFFQHKLRLNVDGFLTDYNNMQINQFAAGTNGSTTIIANAGKVKLSGFEAEFQAAPVQGFSLDGSINYLNTDFEEFLFRDPTTGVVSNVAALAHQIYAPKWQYHIGGEVFHNFDLGMLRLRVDFSHRGPIFFNPLDSVSQFNERIKSPNDVDLRARLSLEEIKVGGKTIEFGIWGDNLTNQKDLIFGIDFGSLGYAGGMFKKPITYGGDIKVTF